MILPPDGVSRNNFVGFIKEVEYLRRKLEEDSNLRKRWMSCMISKIEDGNKFVVPIQIDALAEVQSIESTVALFY